MKQEDKELLLKDLCARLPYGVKCKLIYNDHSEAATLFGIDKYGTFLFTEFGEDVRKFVCKPYLFPLSSMTEEQSKIYRELIGGMFGTGVLVKLEILIDWLNKNHFDYRGLIPMGLALDATGLNIY